MAAKITLKKLGMTDSDHRKQFFGVQGGRCAVCTEDLVYGHATICDKLTKVFFCRTCFNAIVCVRKIRQPLWGKLLSYAKGEA